MYWDFINYSLLEHVINEFGSDQLKEDMRQYIADLEEFRKTTTVAQFAKHSTVAKRRYQNFVKVSKKK